MEAGRGGDRRREYWRTDGGEEMEKAALIHFGSCPVVLVLLTCFNVDFQVKSGWRVCLRQNCI